MDVVRLMAGSDVGGTVADGGCTGMWFVQSYICGGGELGVSEGHDVPRGCVEPGPRARACGGQVYAEAPRVKCVEVCRGMGVADHVGEEFLVVCCGRGSGGDVVEVL